MKRPELPMKAFVTFAFVMAASLGAAAAMGEEADVENGHAEVEASSVPPADGVQGDVANAGGDEADAELDDNIFHDAIRSAQHRTVKIYGAGIAREHGYATGIIVSPDGDILTAHGLYVTGQRIRIVLHDGSVHQAEVVRQSEGLQTVLLSIDADTPDYFEVGEDKITDRGDWVLAVNNAFKVADGEEPLSASVGVVSMRAAVGIKRRTQDLEIASDVLLVDTITSNPGAPGGALVTPGGELAGMVGKIVESATTNTRLNYAIPADVLREFLDGTYEEPEDLLAEAEAAPSADLGLRIFRMPGRRAQAYVDAVRRRSPAARAGIRSDDLILSINGEQIYTIDDYDRVTETLLPDEQVTFVLRREVDGRDALIVARFKPEAAEDDQ